MAPSKDAASTKGGPSILAHFHDARMAARGPDYFAVIRRESPLDRFAIS
jgi:hypothetical protein